MRTEVILSLSIIILLLIIVILGVLIIMPSKADSGYTFDSLTAEMREKRSSLEWVNITYAVNVSLGGSVISGTAYFFRNDSALIYTLSPSIKRFSDYGVMINPDLVVDFINTSSRRDYSFYIDDGWWHCPSVITEPSNDYYARLMNGDYLFVTCFDIVTGYPAIMYNSEVNGGDVFYSKFFIKNITYSFR